MSPSFSSTTLLLISALAASMLIHTAAAPVETTTSRERRETDRTQLATAAAETLFSGLKASFLYARRTTEEADSPLTVNTNLTTSLCYLLSFYELFNEMETQHNETEDLHKLVEKNAADACRLIKLLNGSGNGTTIEDTPRCSAVEVAELQEQCVGLQSFNIALLHAVMKVLRQNMDLERINHCTWLEDSEIPEPEMTRISLLLPGCS